MDLTPNLKLPFPDADDTGATALYLETLARQADAKLGAYRDAFTSYIKPQVIITTNNSTSDANPNIETEQGVLGELWTYSGGQVVYSNLPAGLSSTTSGDFPKPGWWAFGCYKMSSTVTGAANNLGTRVALVAESYDINPGIRTELVRVQRPYFESSTTGEHFEVSGTVYVPAGVVVRAQLYIYHQMSVIRRFSTGCVGFRYYLGSGDVAQKAGF